MEDRPLSGQARPKGRLLLVDDEPNILSALRRLLRSDGYVIAAETDPLAALQKLTHEDFDVIVSDQLMPDLTGVEFLRRARLLRPHSVRIVLSGYTELDTVISAVNEGAIFKFLTKPWDDEQLRGHIAAAMRYKHLEDDNQRMSEELKLVNARQQSLNAQLGAMVHQQRSSLNRDEAVLETLHQILRHLPLPVLGCDEDDTIVFCNEAAEQVISGGAQPVPLLGTTLTTLWPEAPSHPPPWSHAGPAWGGRPTHVECRALDPDHPARGRLYLLLEERVTT